jgi:osmotically-inducible protein OsmY
MCAVGYPQLFAISVSVHGGQVTLDGEVPTYYLKQVAQTAALAVPGVESVENEIVVI